MDYKVHVGLRSIKKKVDQSIWNYIKQTSEANNATSDAKAPSVDKSDDIGAVTARMEWLDDDDDDDPCANVAGRRRRRFGVGDTTDSGWFEDEDDEPWAICLKPRRTLTGTSNPCDL